MRPGWDHELVWWIIVKFYNKRCWTCGRQWTEDDLFKGWWTLPLDNNTYCSECVDAGHYYLPPAENRPSLFDPPYFEPEPD